MLKGEGWVGLEPGRDFFPTDDIAELVQHIEEKQRVLSIFLIAHSFEGRKTLRRYKT